MCHQLEQSTSGMVVFFVRLKMLGQGVDPAGQNGDLHFWRSCVTFGGREFLDKARFFFSSNRHRGLLWLKGDGASRDVAQQGPWSVSDIRDARTYPKEPRNESPKNHLFGGNFGPTGKYRQFD